MFSILAFAATRIARVGAVVMLVSGCAGASHDTALTAPAMPVTPAGAPHDFDFEHGRWHTSLRRLLKPLSGSEGTPRDWAEYSGTSNVHALLGGRANLVELDVAGPNGRIQGVSLRLFDTQRQRWTLNFSNMASGTMELPMTGGFDGTRHGVFYGPDTFKGKPILVRFVVDVIDADTAHFEQAFSADGGKTWEVNWVAVDRRVK